MAAWITDLKTALRHCSGITTNTSVTVNNGDNVRKFSIEIEVNFRQTLHGKADRLLVEFLLNRLGIAFVKKGDLSSLQCRCSETQGRALTKSLLYASTAQLANKPKRNQYRSVALYVLLTHVLERFTTAYNDIPRQHPVIPALPVWSNALRVLEGQPIELREYDIRAVTTPRTRKVIFRHLARYEWITLNSNVSGNPKTVALTSDGISLKKRGEQRIGIVEKAWENQFGIAVLQALRSRLEQIVRSQDLELPFYCTGYGLADESLTGGNYLPASDGPPKVPARGMEWPVVPRHSSVDYEVPLPALLSQALTTYALDFEGMNLGRLGLTANFLKFIPDKGFSLDAARDLAPVSGDGNSLFERHLFIVLEPRLPKDTTRQVLPTPKTRLIRDAFPSTLQRLEQDWIEQYGADEMSELRNCLTVLDRPNNQQLPDYPDTTSWMVPWRNPFLIGKPKAENPSN